ncbi:MAG: hypothetical protein ABI716_03435 [Candidatus Saccharibacteria bacterium]
MASPESRTYDPNWDTAPQQTERFGDRLKNRAANYLQDPENQAHAKEVAQQMGMRILAETVEGSGLAKYDDYGKLKVSKFGVLRAIANPTGAARRAATGAVRGARHGAAVEVRSQARGALNSAAEYGKGYGKDMLTARFDAPAAIESYSTPSVDDWGDTIEVAPQPYSPVESSADRARSKVDGARDKINDLFSRTEMTPDEAASKAWVDANRTDRLRDKARSGKDRLVSKFQKNPTVEASPAKTYEDDWGNPIPSPQSSSYYSDGDSF